MAGRGKAQKSINLIADARAILEGIRPASVRAVAYQLFTLYRQTNGERGIPSMARKDVRVVSEQLVDARMSGAIPLLDWIVDNTRQPSSVLQFDGLEEYGQYVRRMYRRNRWTMQPRRVVVWSEKDAVSGTLDPVMETYGVTFLPVRGFSSLTKVAEALWDAARGQPVVIKYVGDLDPSGMGMSGLDLPRRLPDVREVLWRQYRKDADISIDRVALVPQDGLDLGRAMGFPASQKGPDPETLRPRDSRYGWFVANYGDWCWELDAMNPNVLRARVEAAIQQEIEPTAWRQAELEEQGERQVTEALADAFVRAGRNGKDASGESPQS